jgi:hypothetical protein
MIAAVSLSDRKTDTYGTYECRSPWTVWTPAIEGDITAAVEQEPWKSAGDITQELGLVSSSTLWESCLAVVQCNISRKVDCMASSVAGSTSGGFFPMGALPGLSCGKIPTICDNG